MIMINNDSIKTYKFILFAFLFLLPMMLWLFSINKDMKSNNIIMHDEKEVDENLLIDSNKSDNFDYHLYVYLKKEKDEHGFMNVIYKLRITPKAGKVYNNVMVTAFLDESLKSAFTVQNFLGFGTDVSENITFGSLNKGLEVGRSTLLTDYYDIDTLKYFLIKDIKVKVIWKTGEEYVILSPENVELICD